MSSEVKVFGISLPIIVIIMLVIIVIFAVALILMYRQLMSISRKYYSITKGTSEKDFEKIVLTRFREMDKMKAYMNKLNRDHKEILLRSNSCISRSGLVRYNAFNDLSGELSFSLALLDRDYNGIVVTSMHSRESCYTYAKEIIKGESYISLSKEELEAIEKAKTIDEEILSAENSELPQDEIFETLVSYEEFPEPVRKKKKSDDFGSETSSLSERGLNVYRRKGRRSEPESDIIPENASSDVSKEKKRRRLLSADLSEKKSKKKATEEPTSEPTAKRSSKRSESGGADRKHNSTISKRPPRKSSAESQRPMKSARVSEEERKRIPRRRKETLQEQETE